MRGESSKAWEKEALVQGHRLKHGPGNGPHRGGEGKRWKQACRRNHRTLRFVCCEVLIRLLNIYGSGEFNGALCSCQESRTWTGGKKGKDKGKGKGKRCLAERLHFVSWSLSYLL